MITITKIKGGDVVIGGDQKPPSYMIKLDGCANKKINRKYGIVPKDISGCITLMLLNLTDNIPNFYRWAFDNRNKWII
jgi:hypothetical protein